MVGVTLCCEKCGWQTVCGQTQLERRLRTLGLLRRAPNPPEELVAELLSANLGQLVCDHCQHVGLFVEGDKSADQDDWQQAVVCQICNQPIPPERLEIFPNVRRCVGCQDAADRGIEKDEPDFCPKCGALVELRVSRTSGITRYKLFCTGNPSCRL